MLRLIDESPIIAPLVAALCIAVVMALFTTALVDINYPWRNRKNPRLRMVLTYLLGFVLAVVTTVIFLGSCIGLIHLDHSAAKALKEHHASE